MTVIGEHPRAGLVAEPSRLERWSRLSEYLRVEVLAKREDVSGIGLGGNKLRKLDLILGQAIRDQIDTVITVGGIQSNHCRLTAACAARLGMRCILYLRGDPGEGLPRGNVLMNRLFGAEVNIINTPDYSGPEEAAALRKHDLEKEGRRVLIIPLGGADGLGTLAFAQAAGELHDQCKAQGVRPASVFLAAGTGSTAAGLSLGMSLIASRTQVVALSVSRKKELLLTDMRAQQLLALCAAGSERSWDDLAIPLLVLDDYVGDGYTRPTPAGLKAVALLGRLEGVAADLTYTGKALAGLITLIQGGFEKGPVVFWHTGGVPELFSRDKDTLRALLSGGWDE